MRAITCGVCSRTISSPISLTCSHVFCFRCIWPIFVKGSRVFCPTCGRKSDVERVSICHQTRKAVELFYKYWPSMPRNSRPEMKEADIDTSKQVLFSVSVFTSRYVFHKYCAMCNFPHKWVNLIFLSVSFQMATFAKKLGEHGHPFFLKKKLAGYLQQTLRVDKTDFEICERCQDWPHCTKLNCKYIHPMEPCLRGDVCHDREECPFLHGEDYLHVYTVIESQWDLSFPLTEPIPLKKLDE
ncbi:unnamed protein product [Hymenolepis diminuta]|uniref:RING-type domain-containing protein n=1 Tax=Hymenolepis diminuta TaxID=6216 RepID=A0A0R3SDG7_HYMDI|nr:unnamed protein product [Hymenolepis diminuta]